MTVIPTELPEVLVIEPRVFRDERGHFLETYHGTRYRELGIPWQFVQDNLSHSRQGVLRGLHYQWGHAQGKLVMVTHGEVFDVAVDIRRGSPTFGRWAAVVLSAADYRQLYIPAGFAHGFCVTSPTATVVYKCTEYYCAQDEHGILWNDPALAIEWPVIDPLLSAKDRANPSLADVPSEHLPSYRSR
jgi:dTDP-4-dehydrorhamnose 3,5-epimerase